MLPRELLMLVRMNKATKSKLLCVLHRSPPSHGAARVGDFIASSEKLKGDFDCRFITIKSSETISDIGKISFKKIYYVLVLYVKILWVLLLFRPQKIYYTASIRSIAFYRDLVVSTLWKIYRRFNSTTEIYYHYHTKGIEEFISSSRVNLKLTRFFIKDVKLILLGKMLEKDFEKVKTYNKVFHLPNGVENTFEDIDFNEFLEAKFTCQDSIEVLYLSQMTKSKGCFIVLELAKKTTDHSIHYNFAGNWLSEADEKQFFNYIEENNLSEKVTFHGFVKNNDKRKLFKKTNLFLHPTQNDAFPLAILEALSYGIPVIATNEGSIPSILNKKTGVVINDSNKLIEVIDRAKKKLINKDTAVICREHYLKYFTNKIFEENFIAILKDG